MASYTLLWSKARCEQVKAQASAGEPLSILFGGPHQSEPGFRKFGVTAGDFIYPVTVSAGVLYILGRMKVSRLLSIDEYIGENAETFAGHKSSFGGGATFGNWRIAHPELSYLAPTCTEEAAVGEGTPLGMRVPVPADILVGLRYRSQKGERTIKYIVDGFLKSVVSLQGGTYRLSDASAQKFEELLKQETSD